MSSKGLQISNIEQSFCRLALGFFGEQTSKYCATEKERELLDNAPPFFPYIVDYCVTCSMLRKPIIQRDIIAITAVSRIPSPCIYYFLLSDNDGKEDDYLTQLPTECLCLY